MIRSLTLYSTILFSTLLGASHAETLTISGNNFSKISDNNALKLENALLAGQNIDIHEIHGDILLELNSHSGDYATIIHYLNQLPLSKSLAEAVNQYTEEALDVDPGLSAAKDLQRKARATMMGVDVRVFNNTAFERFVDVNFIYEDLPRFRHKMVIENKMLKFVFPSGKLSWSKLAQNLDENGNLRGYIYTSNGFVALEDYVPSNFTTSDNLVVVSLEALLQEKDAISAEISIIQNQLSELEKQNSKLEQAKQNLKTEEDLAKVKEQLKQNRAQEEELKNEEVRAKEKIIKVNKEMDENAKHAEKLEAERIRLEQEAILKEQNASKESTQSSTATPTPARTVLKTPFPVNTPTPTRTPMPESKKFIIDCVQKLIEAQQLNDLIRKPTIKAVNLIAPALQETDLLTFFSNKLLTTTRNSSNTQWLGMGPRDKLKAFLVEYKNLIQMAFGLDADWTYTQVRKEFRKVAMSFHPDKVSSCPEEVRVLCHNNYWDLSNLLEIAGALKSEGFIQ